MPMEISQNPGSCAKNALFKRSKIAFNCRNSRRTSSRSSVNVAMPMTPLMRTWVREAKISERSKPSAVSRSSPNLLSSRAIWNSSRQGMTRPYLAACLWISANRSRLSTDSIAAMKGAIWRTLFFCRCPMKCHSMSLGRASAFGRSSCTLFSANKRCPLW